MKSRSEINRQPHFLILFLLSACLCIGAGAAFAQTVTGSIYGTVTDSTGAVVPQAQVTVTNINTGETHTNPTDASGSYTFLTLVPGDYTVMTLAAGFQKQIQKDIRLDANQNVHASFTLQAGAANQEVTVEAATPLVDTRESQIAFTVDQQRIQDLPTNGRNAYDLLQITPGVTSYTQDTSTGSRAGTQLSVNGLPTNNTAFYLDGGYDTNVWQFGGNLLPNPDALQEFRVLTSSFDAEFGRSPGGVVSAITRSGTNQYHGLIFEYLRNNMFTAKNYFSGATDLHQNQFGGNFGGPILPRLRDKAFFFVTYQGLRQHLPANITSGSLVTPTTLERQGDFSQSTNKPTTLPAGTNCGTTAQPVICTAALDPVAQNLLAFVPTGPNPPQQSANANTTSDQGMGRIDYKLSDKHQLSAMYFMSRGTANNPAAGANQILSYAGMEDYEGQYNAVLSDTWLISPTKVNDFRAYYALNHYIIQNIYGNQHMLPDLGSQAAMGGNYNAQPYFSITGYWTMGTSNAGPNNLPSSTLGASDTLNWTLGKHEMKFGGAFMWDRFTSTGGASSNGLFTFTGSTSGNALADFLLGKANALTQNNGVFFRSHSQDPSVFAQDNWKLTQRLTLNLGLRWEYYPMYTGQNDTGTFVPNVQSTRFPTAPLGLLTSGDAGIPDGILHTPWNTFAPRLGFAYDVFGNGKTSLRGAYGIFYAAIDQVSISNNLVQQPFSRSVTVNKTPNLVCPYGGSVPPCPSGTPAGTDPFPYAPNPTNAVFLSGANLFSMPPNNKSIPSVQEFNLTVQQQYSSKWSSQIAYIGNVSRHFYLTVDENAPIYNSTCTSMTCGSTAQINARRPYEPTPSTYTFAQISEVKPVSNSSYHSLQATLTRQFDHHFALIASYVWSKSIGFGAPVNSYDINSARGLLSIDVPQEFVASYIWVSPDIHHFGVVGKQLLSGWQLNGITTLRTGTPFNITSGSDTNFDGVSTTDRPNLVGSPYLPGGRDHAQRISAFFNKAAFASVSTGQPYGTTPFDYLIGPGYINTDLSAFKKFPIYGTSALEFRAEAFDLFNNVNLSAPNAVLSSPKFATISSTVGSPISGPASSRILQFALRLSF